MFCAHFSLLDINSLTLLNIQNRISLFTESSSPGVFSASDKPLDNLFMKGYTEHVLTINYLIGVVKDLNNES